MKKFTAFSLIFMLFFSNIANDVMAAVNVGQANENLQGDYVVIVNTDLENSQSTGSIIFDDSGLNINSSSKSLSPSKESGSSEESIEVLSLDSEEVNVNKNSKSTTTYEIGDVKRIGPTENTKKTYTLIGIGDKSYIWMENSIKAAYDAVNKTDLAAKEVIKVYEGAPYDILNELADGNIPYSDNSGKLSILIEDTGGNTGYYYGEKDITAIHVKAVDANSFKAGGYDNLNGLLAHEGQHALFNKLICNHDSQLAHKYSWINEGISVAVMDKLWGYSDSNGWLTRINDHEAIRNGSSLLYSDYRSSTAQDYSMPYLFVRYLAAQATNNGDPIDFLKKLYTMDATGKTTEQFMNEIIKQIPNLKDKTFKDILGSFYVAAFSPEKTGEYSFYGDTVVTDKVTSYPIYLGESGKALSLEPSAAIVVKTLGGNFTVPSDAGSDVKFYAVTKNNDIYKPAAGNGTASDPYIITDVDELNSLGKYPNAYFKLGNDIDVSKGSFFTAESFSGNLNGNGYTINNLNKPLVNKNNGSITNLNVNANINIEVISNFGVIAKVNSGTISDVKSTGELNLNAIVANQNLKATVGGIVGENQPSGIIERVNFDGNININMAANDANIGGLVGYNMGLIKNSYSKGNIEVSQKNTGSYSLYLGGLVGLNNYLSYGDSIRTSYSIMNLNSNGVTVKRIGSIVGYLKKGTIGDSYGIDKYEPLGGEQTNLDSKKTLIELQSQSTFAKWDFDTVWKMDSNTDKTPIFRTGNDITSISAKLSQVNYIVGEQLILYGFDVLTVNGKEIELTSQMLNMNEFDSSTVGKDKVINGSYMGKKFTVTYNVVEPKTVTDLQIYEKGKVDYIEGENYSDKGVVLKAKINGSPYDTYIYSGYTNNLSSQLNKNNTEVEFSYFGQTVKQNITVKEKSISSITVFNSADKSTYVPGNTVNLSGIRYQINYSNGSKTKVLGYSDLNSYNLKVAQTDDSGKNAVDFDLGKTLQESDNNTKLHIYYGTALPGESGAISAEVVTLSVAKRLYMEDKTFRAVKGNYGYWRSESVLNSNYDVNTTLKSGSLPPGVTTYGTPSDSRDSFSFEGTPTTLGTYAATYTITKNDGSDSIDVTFTFNVEEVSNEPLLEALTLSKSQNPSLPNDIEGVIDNVNNTIKFTVPYGTDVTKLQPIPTYYKNSSLPSNLWNGAIVDFTKPVAYEVTAEDGKTKKTYMVSVEVLPSPDGISSIDIDNKITDIKVGSTFTFSATVNGFGNFDRSVTWEIEGATSKNTIISNNGTLTIGEDEISKAIKVIATASGDTSKTLEISINIIQKQQLNKVTELIWDRRLVRWREVLNAKTYELNIYKDDQLIQTIVVATNEYDLNSFIKEAGKYSFTVIAKADGYKDSEVSDKSSILEFKNAKPVISGADDIEIEFGSSFDIKSGITASDEEDNDLTPKIEVEGTVDTNTSSTYTLKYSVTDSDNNTTTIERKVTVKEKTTNPTEDLVHSVNIETPSNTNIEKGESLTLKAIVTGTGNISKDVTWSVEGNNSSKTTIDSNGVLTVGSDETSETIKIIATSVTDKTKTASITVNIVEKVLAKLNKAENLIWNEMVATWDKVTNATRYKVDLYRNDILVVEKVVDINGKETKTLLKSTDTVSYDFSEYFTDEGEYRFTVVAEADGYISSDKAGENNNSSNNEDNVVIYENKKPEITANDVTIKVGDSFDELQGVTAYDKEDGDLSNSIKVIENTVDINNPGVYTVTYKVVDKKGLETIKSIIVTVLSNEKPVISGADNIKIEFNSNFDKKAGVSATDYEDKDLSASIVITGEVDTKIPGIYELIYSVTDSDKNTTTVKRIVTVKEEVKPENPEIAEDAVIKANDITIKLGEEFNPLKGVEVIDPKDINIINDLKYTSDVNTNKPGIYTVKYEVVGSNGNLVTKTIVVTVLSNEKPVISGADNIKIEFNSNFDKKAGVSATDYEDKDLSASIVITGEVDTKIPGIYELIYSVTDSDKNTTTVKRIITVKEEVKPENPETPVKPEEPNEPEDSETPVKPEEPNEPEDSETPVKPEEPNESEDSETPVEPEEPSESEDSEMPIKPEEPSSDSDKVETEDTESNKEELPKTGDDILAVKVSILSSIFILISCILRRRKTN